MNDYKTELKTELTSCSDPLRAIEAFQVSFKKFFVFKNLFFHHKHLAEKWNQNCIA
jgi:hypothetical protein